LNLTKINPFLFILFKNHKKFNLVFKILIYILFDPYFLILYILISNFIFITFNSLISRKDKRKSLKKNKVFGQRLTDYKNADLDVNNQEDRLQVIRYREKSKEKKTSHIGPSFRPKHT